MAEILKNPALLGNCWFAIGCLLAIAWTSLIWKKKVLWYRGYSMSASIVLVAATVVASVQQHKALVFFAVLLVLLNLLFLVLFWKGIPMRSDELDDENF